MNDHKALAAYLGFVEDTLNALAAKKAAIPIPRRLARVTTNLAGLRARTPGTGVVAEFGVYKGHSIRRMARWCPRTRFIGFDSFCGFPEDGRVDWQQDFSVVDLPKVPANVALVPGWFDETVREYFKANAAPLSMVHIDCDLYSSTDTVFDALGECGLLRPGLILMFDELINYEGFLWNEMLALHRMLENRNLSIDPVFVAGKVRAVDDTLAMLNKGRHPTMRADQRGGFFQQAVVALREGAADPRPADPQLVERFIDQTRARGSAYLFA